MSIVQSLFTQQYSIKSSRSLSPSQYADLQSLLTTSFKNEPFLKCVVPGLKEDQVNRRESFTSWMFSRRLQLFLPYSYTLLKNSDQSVVGHAALSPPTATGMSGPSLWRKISLGFFLAPFIHGFETMSRFDKGVKTFKKTQYEEKLWALEAVAISPSERGKGIGTAFMNELFIKVVPRGDSVYMATQLKSNVRFYERIGFSTYKDTVESVGEGKDKVKFDNWFMSLNTTDFGR